VAKLTRPGRKVAGGTTANETKGNARRTQMRKVMGKETKGNSRKMAMNNMKNNGGSTEMNNVMEMVDSCMKTQKEFMDNCAQAQKEGLERWAETTVKLQKPFLAMAGTQEGPMKEMMGIYSTCMTTMMNSAKTVADESGKIQETWKSAAEKQMEMTREMMQKMTGFFQPVCAQK
jgi:type II secretory pathway component PulF